MARYAAFLRGVSPMNAKMPELKRAFEKAGFTNVRTLLSSGNVVFDARAADLRKVAQATKFAAFVRSVAELQELIERDPFAGAPDGKRVVTFLRKKPPRVKLPIELDGARILATDGLEVFSVYVPGPKGPVFMSLIEKTFGKDVTTRTWDTVRKVSAA
jgi:uncharacterized protein (DUF1697 family)